MRKFALVIAVLFVAGLALAQAGEAKAAGKTHDVTAEVVSVDMNAHTITIKDEKGENKTAPVQDAAIDSLKGLKAGDKVVLTCLDNDKGEHQAVVKIKKA
jgi:Cu/Ag efflux protein CusF